MQVQTSIRPGSPVKVQFSTLVDPGIHHSLKVYAARQRLNMRELVESACRQFLRSRGVHSAQVPDHETARLRERMRVTKFPLHLAMLVVEMLVRGDLAPAGADLMIEVWEQYGTFGRPDLPPA